MRHGRVLSAACLIVLACTSLSGCNKDEIIWDRVNGTDDTLMVIVTPEGVLGDAIAIDLTPVLNRSNTLGTATVDPGSGPVGTEHELTVELSEDVEELVQRVTVKVSAQGRGSEEWELRRDPAFIGTWGISVESLGAPDEGRREDSFNVRLWTPLDDPGESTSE
ncbi:MAG: hypothetical protein ACI8PZ_005916 [Myxococcota bacterium]|jgi:hypothetical protein